MDRRSFLKGISAGVAVAAVPSSLLAAEKILLPTSSTIIRDDFIIDYAERTIGRAPGAPTVSVLDMFKYLKNAWKTDEDLIRHPFPIMAISPSYACLEEDWTIEDFDIFHDGMIETQEGHRYAACVSLGEWDAPGPIIVQRPGLPETSEIGPQGMFRLTPEIDELEFGCHDDSIPQSFCTEILSRANSKTTCGFKHLYHELRGSLFYPRPWAYSQWAKP